MHSMQLSSGETARAKVFLSAQPRRTQVWARGNVQTESRTARLPQPASTEDDMLRDMSFCLLHDVPRTVAVSAALLAVVGMAAAAQTVPRKRTTAEQVPVYRIDPAWPNHCPTTGG